MKPRRHVLACAFGSMLAVATGPGLAPAQQPLNFDFERPSVAGPERPWGELRLVGIRERTGRELRSR